MTTATSSKTGKGKYGDRPEGAIGYPVNAEKFNQYIVQMYSVLYGDDPRDASDFPTINDGEFIAMRVKDVGLPGRRFDDEHEALWALICTEGVGYTPDEYRVIEMHFHSGFHVYRIHLYNGRVEDFIDLDGPTVDLADHVRVFGDRLESNFSLWFSRKFD